MSEQAIIRSKISEILRIYKEWETENKQFLCYGQNNGEIPKIYVEDINKQVDSVFDLIFKLRLSRDCMNRPFMTEKDTKEFRETLKEVIYCLENGK